MYLLAADKPRNRGVYRGRGIDCGDGLKQNHHHKPGLKLQMSFDTARTVTQMALGGGG